MTRSMGTGDGVRLGTGVGEGLGGACVVVGEGGGPCPAGWVADAGGDAAGPTAPEHATATSSAQAERMASRRCISYTCS